MQLSDRDRSHPTVEFEMDKYDGGNQSSIEHSCAVPVGYQHAKVRMRFKSCTDYSDEVTIEKIVQNGASVHEVALHDRRFVVMKVTPDKDAKERMKVYIEPPLRFTNSLPKSVYV